MSYEPIIVTTLRRYVRRRAPDSLLQRIAGSRRDWRTLNEAWNIDGMAWLRLRSQPQRHIEGQLALSEDERRIALRQIAVECVESSERLPVPGDLARYFGVTISQIVHDLRSVDLPDYPQGGLCVSSPFGADGESA